MNSSWTGRAPRMLRDCHFSDGADPIERTRRAKTSNGEIFAYIAGLLLVLLVVHVVAR
jgi:hypothetical protein